MPVKTKKKPRKQEEKTVFLLYCEDRLALRRREASGLLGGLWELPNTEGCLSVEEAVHLLREWGFGDVYDIEWQMTSFIVACGNMPETFVWVTKAQLEADITIPSAFSPFLEGI